MAMLEALKSTRKTAPRCQTTFGNLKKNETDYKIDCDILRRIGEVRNPQRICKTCAYEKMEIANTQGGTLLNKRNGLICSCVHFKKFYFKT